MARRILLTCFEPFGPWTENASELAVTEFASQYSGPAALEVTKFAVDFGSIASELRNALARSYDLVILTGQSRKAAMIELEAIAVNVRSEHECGPFSHLRSDAPVAYQTNCDVQRWANELNKLDIPASVSHHAGTYLCNAVYFQAMHIQEVQGGPQVVFVHFPLTPGQSPGPEPGGNTLPTAKCVEACRLMVQEAGAKF